MFMYELCLVGHIILQQVKLPEAKTFLKKEIKMQ